MNDADMEDAGGMDAADETVGTPTGQVSTPALGATGLPDDWREMKWTPLAELCKAAGLSAVGKRAELIKRLDAHYHGSSSQHINGKTLCPYCKAPARCNGTRRMSETTVRRTYHCSGKRRHSFSLVETVGG